MLPTDIILIGIVVRGKRRIEKNRFMKKRTDNIKLCSYITHIYLILFSTIFRIKFSQNKYN